MAKQNNEVVDGEFEEEHQPMTVVNNALAVQTNTYAPAMTVQEAMEIYEQQKAFVQNIMHKDVDFGEIPGTSKATLLKPGAEKLTTFFGLTVKYIDEKIIEDFDKPLFFYRRKCQLWKGDRLIAEASGSCNSMEDRYAWRWVQPHEVPADLDRSTLQKRVSSIGEWDFAYKKRETSGKYGKPETYWEQFDQASDNGTLKRINKEQHWDGKTGLWLEIESILYRVPNDNIFTLVNTFLKIADKRALVAATLIACNASEYFTQDLEDIVDVQPVAQPKPAATTQTSSPPPPPPPPQTEQHNQPAENLVPKPKRPMTPEQVKDGIEVAKAKFLGETANDKDRNRLAAAINNAFAVANPNDGQDVQDAKRYTVISWLKDGGSGSTKSLSHEEVLAMLAWTGQKDNSLFVASKDAQKEILAIHRQAMKDDGQIEMEIPEE